MKKILYFLFLSICIGCSNNLTDNPLKHFEYQQNIKANKIINLEKYEILDPKDVIIYKNWYIFNDYNKIGGIIKCLSKDFSKNVSGLKEGNGPLDVIGAINIELFSDSIYIKDMNHKKILNIDIKDTLLIKVLSNNCSVSTHGLVIEKDKFISVGNLDSTFMFITLIDINNKVLSKIPFPDEEKTSNLDSLFLWQIYLNTNLVTNPAKNKFAYACYDFPKYGFGIIKNDSLSIFNELNYQSPNFSIESDYVFFDKDSERNVIASIGTDKYAIFLYSGRKHNDLNFTGNILLFYNWQGEPIKRIDVDYDLYDINYDKELNILYCLGKNPESILVEYDMNGIID